jgi:DNA-binding transcriptional LysR family regulator
MFYSSAVEIFRAVMKRGNFAGAADELGILGAAVSKQIKSLEQRLNLVLFYRTTRSVVPTEAAQRLADLLVRNHDEFGTLLDQLSDAQATPSGRLRVNVPMSFGELFLRRPIAISARRYPDVTVDVDFDDRRVHLVEDGYDLVVRIGVLEDSGLIARRVGDCPLYMCAAPKLLEDHGTPVSPADIPALPAVIYSLAAAALSWSCRDADGAQTTVGLRPALYANSAGMMLDACIEGVGVAILPHFSCADALASGRLVRLLPEFDTVPDLGIYVVYPDKRFVPLKVRSFIDVIAAELASRQARFAKL